MSGLTLGILVPADEHADLAILGTHVIVEPAVHELGEARGREVDPGQPLDRQPLGLSGELTM